jgi:hypothetical protein
MPGKMQVEDTRDLTVFQPSIMTDFLVTPGADITSRGATPYRSLICIVTGDIFRHPIALRSCVHMLLEYFAPLKHALKGSNKHAHLERWPILVCFVLHKTFNVCPAAALVIVEPPKCCD